MVSKKDGGQYAFLRSNAVKDFEPYMQGLIKTIKCHDTSEMNCTMDYVKSNTRTERKMHTCILMGSNCVTKKITCLITDFQMPFL